jgi:putative ABC transport system ATP-binding protein
MAIEIRNLKKIYKMGVERVHALRGIDLRIEDNEFVAIMGASGSGKSTILNILGCLDRPTSGQYLLSGHPTHKMRSSRLSQVRNEEIGFIFQSFELLPRATSLKNVMLPMIYSRQHMFSARKRARRALKRVGLGDRIGHKPNQLSGGQRQRVAIARALVNSPSILLADEPTGNLDSETTNEIIALFKELHDEGQTIIVVTHEEDVAGHAQRIVRLRDGLIMSDFPTDEDPIHQRFRHTAAAAAAAATGNGGDGNVPAPQDRPAIQAEPKDRPDSATAKESTSPKTSPKTGPTTNGATTGTSDPAVNGTPIVSARPLRQPREANP